MRLRNHVAFRVLTDEKFRFQITYAHNEMDKHKDVLTAAVVSNDWDNLMAQRPAKDMMLDALMLSPKRNKCFLVTETVTDKLDLLKVKRQENGVFDWSVFSHLDGIKRTFILPGDEMIRLYFDSGFMMIFWLRNNGDVLIDGTKQNHCNYTKFWIHRDGRISQNIHSQEVKDVDEMIYKLLCFVYLSDNEEILLNPGDKIGTKKTGKIINETAFPVTILNSRWNITSVRTEGFAVSGHFRLQPCGQNYSETKMIWIDPFEKHGYVRRAGKDIDTNNTIS